VHPRHPWAGELVYTAFSGSHQDAIKKGMYAQKRSDTGLWDVPYLAIDPMDVGRTYEAIIRVNSQSGKGGVAYLMETEHHLELPRGLQVDFAQQVQAITDARGDELSADELLAAFHDHYLAYTRPYELVSYSLASEEDEDRIVAKMLVAGEPQEIEGAGNGPIAALVDAFERQFGVSISLRDYHEHAMAASATATAAAYVEADVDDDSVWGVGLHPSIVTASLRAVVNAVNRAIAAREALAAASAAFESR
jgi:2-isopropylmalate synthase